MFRTYIGSERELAVGAAGCPARTHEPIPEPVTASFRLLHFPTPCLHCDSAAADWLTLIVMVSKRKGQLDRKPGQTGELTKAERRHSAARMDNYLNFGRILFRRQRD